MSTMLAGLDVQARQGER